MLNCLYSFCIMGKHCRANNNRKSQVDYFIFTLWFELLISYFSTSLAVLGSKKCERTKNVDRGPLFEQLWPPRRDGRIDEKISRTCVESLECQMLIMYLPSHAGTKIRDLSVNRYRGTRLICRSITSEDLCSFQSCLCIVEFSKLLKVLFVCDKVVDTRSYFVFTLLIFLRL